MPLTAIQCAALAVLLPLVGGPLAYLLDRLGRTARNVVVVGSLALSLLLALFEVLGADAAPTLRLIDPAASPLGAGLSLALSPTGRVALPLLAAICLVIAGFSTAYVQPGRFVAGYFALLLVASGGLLALPLAGDLLTLAALAGFVGLALAALVGLDFAPEAGRAALKLLFAIEVGATLLLAASWLILARGGSIEVDGLVGRVAQTGGQPPIALGLLGGGLAILAGLAPAHTWLTSGSRVALTPVAALLCGILPTAAGLILLRMLASGSVAPVEQALLLLGGLSVVVGALGALGSGDFRRAFAFQAVGQAGFAAIALGLAGGAAVALGQLVTLALALPALTLGVGEILQAVKGDELRRFPGQRAYNSVAAAAALVGAASLAAIPPLPGYWVRLWLLDLLLRPGRWHLPLLAVALVGTVLLSASLLRLLAREAEAATGRAPRRLGFAIPLLGLAIVSLALSLPDLIGSIGGLAGGSASSGGVVAAFLVLAAVGLGMAWRLGEVSLLPSRLQGSFDRAAGLLKGAGKLGARVGQRIRPELLDPFALAAGLVWLAAWMAAFVLDNTLGRLSRSA